MMWTLCLVRNARFELYSTSVSRPSLVNGNISRFTYFVGLSLIFVCPEQGSGRLRSGPVDIDWNVLMCRSLVFVK